MGICITASWHYAYEVNVTGFYPVLVSISAFLNTDMSRVDRCKRSAVRISAVFVPFGLTVSTDYRESDNAHCSRWGGNQCNRRKSIEHQDAAKEFTLSSFLDKS
ncbi:hypothetical protein [Nostoc sp.]